MSKKQRSTLTKLHVRFRTLKIISYSHSLGTAIKLIFCVHFSHFITHKMNGNHLNYQEKKYRKKTEDRVEKIRTNSGKQAHLISSFYSERNMEVFIYVYTFRFMLFFTLEHTEVRFGPVHVGYSPSGLRVSDFSNRNMSLKTIIFGGSSDLTLREFYVYLRELRIILESQKYCLFFHNCRHVSLKILQVLDCAEGQGKKINSNTMILSHFRIQLYHQFGSFIRRSWMVCL